MIFVFNPFTILIFIAVAAMLLFTLYNTKERDDRLQTNGVRARGVIVQNKIKWGSTTVVRPIIRFETQDGRTIEALHEHGVALAVPRYPEGTTVTVLYDPVNPRDFSIIAADRQYI
ncbi:DUF3592 domain-containing protein [Hymenobacter aerilatus]|uniref:DUF3592 domain-containing protein n=1 Tax=Hymenobacter aerilatus TaxID=2932251 RepID=A0A8T9SU01_9BACT|nr:DUF3592 domain-containing protein [Hymenobacter aerilatus]UOR05652.1 DUF3592 domain-containing protein [Hymenobacter aerilatus]